MKTFDIKIKKPEFSTGRNSLPLVKHSFSARLFFWLTVLVVTLGLASLALAWSNPTVAPPGGNLSGFLDSSSTAQTKSGALTIATSTYLATTGGNVGIGTTGPGATLDVNGTSIFRNTMYVKAGAGNSVVNATWSGTDDGNLYVLSGGVNKILLNGNGSSYFNSGNVGIGTTGPEQRLTVQKADGASGFGSKSQLRVGHSANEGVYLTGSDNNANALSFGGEFTGGDGVELFATNSWTARNTSASVIADYAGVGLRFYTNASLTAGSTFTPTERMVITTAGNVGIGTTSPGAKLDVAGVIKIGVSGGPTWDTNTFLWGESGFGARYDSYQHRFDVGVSRTEAMRITGTGNVGIGTTNPGSKLEVNGSISLTNGASYQPDRIYYVAGAPFYVLRNTDSVGVRLDNGATAWAAQSDIRLKDIIEPISDGIQKVLAINPVIYRLKTDDPTVRRSGIIAQDVQKVLPEAVSVGDDGYLNVRYTELIPLTIAAIKELDIRTKDLTLTSTGDLNISQDNSGDYVVEKTESAFVKTAVDKIGAFGQLIAANIKAGLVIAKEVTSKKITVENLSVKNLELVDQITGGIYCVGIKNGEWFKEKGSCQ